jgi:2-iminobutanoate/2-iminopropanoate deaminase
MLRESLSTSDAPAAIGPYSQAMRTEGRLLFCSGQIPLTPSGELINGDIRDQARQCMENVKGLLSAAGLEFGNIAKTTIFLSSMDYFAPANEVYGSYFESEPPARSTVAVAGLPKGVDIEIEVIAVY